METTYEYFWSLFFDEQISQFKRSKEQNTKFVHYTTAENIIKIIDGKSVWLRNVRSMNDYSEIRHGIQLINEFFADKEQNTLWELIEERQAGLSDEVKNKFNSTVDKIFMDTYIACVSEFDAESIPIGKLSMWRAYAQNNGVAAVLHPRAMIGTSGTIGANTYPVIYANRESAFSLFKNFVNSIKDNKSKFLSMEPSQISHLVGIYFSTMSFSLKHKAFSEEKEWRIVYRPWEQQSEFLKIGFESVKGVPQPIYRFPLEDSEQYNIHQIYPNKLIESIIIGPSNDAYLIERALKDCLRRNDFLDFENRVFASNIPLRL